MTFAGLWVDGAVRRPEQRHCDSEDTVIAKWKRKGDHEQTLGVSNEFDICHRYFPNWDCVYWLDTTPRESLTPEELFSVVKVLWPRCNAVLNPSGATVGWQIEFDDTNEHTEIAWGNLTQYPPPAELQWIRITRENIGQYLFCECRFRDIESQPWRVGKIAGWDERDNCCLVNSDFEEEMPIMQWCIVEVQNAATP